MVAWRIGDGEGEARVRAPCETAVVALDAQGYDDLMRTIGRTLQLVGLVVLPVSMLLELTGGLERRFGVSDMVVMLGFGVACFTIGWYLQGASSR